MLTERDLIEADRLIAETEVRMSRQRAALQWLDRDSEALKTGWKILAALMDSIDHMRDLRHFIAAELARQLKGRAGDGPAAEKPGDQPSTSRRRDEYA